MPPEELTEEEQRANLERAKEAERYHIKNVAQISQHQYQPKLVWTLRPFSGDELRQTVEAGGSSPFRYISHMLLDNRGRTFAGAPYWAAYTYLVMVEVRARGVGG